MFGVAGGCRGDDITTVKTDYVRDCGTEVIVNIPETKKSGPKLFLISGEFAKIVQKYMQLRPANVTTDRFFLQYHQGECQCQVIGKNKVAIVPKEIAKFLKLDDFKSYTGHSFQPTILSSSGIETTIKRRRWKSSKIGDGQLQNDPLNKPYASKQLDTFTNVNNIIMSQRQRILPDASGDVFYEITNLNEQESEICSEPILPMLPLTMALMKRKSKFYMGLQPTQFSRLLQLASQRKQLSDVKLMVALRKLRLDEDFEVIADAFDLDKAIAEQYYHEAKHIVMELVDLLTATTTISNHYDVIAEPIIKIEECDTPYIPDPIALEPITTHNYDSSTEMNADDDDDDFEFTLPFSAEDDRGFLSEDIRKRTAQCPVCNKFYAPRLLDSHMQSVHFNQLNLNRTICGLCWKEFDTVVLLKTHQKEAHGGCCYGCEVCGKLFSSKRYLSVHILSKHTQLKTHLCEACGEGFPVPYLLKYHVKRKHEQRSHDCHLCDKIFATAAALKDHICARHTDERPYKCDVKGCGKTFSWPSSFKSHKRVHASDKYECSICLKRFSFKGNLQNHLKTIHNQIVNNDCLSSTFI